jgi:hypothetical protein
MSIWPSCPMMMGTARRSEARDSRNISFTDECYCAGAADVQRSFA